MGRIQILSALLYLGLCSGASCMYSYHPDFVTSQGVRVYLDGVQMSKGDANTAFEILLSNLEDKEKPVREYLDEYGTEVKFTSGDVICGGALSFGCYALGSLKLYTPDCPFEGSLSHEFAHFALDVTEADPDQAHKSELFCGYPDECFEETTQKMLKEELCENSTPTN